MPKPTTIGLAVAQARALGVARLDAQLLLAHSLGHTRTWLIAHESDVVSDALVSVAAGLVARRAAGEPLAYLLGEREFRGLALRVTPDVLVPRPDTETLVEWALDLLAGLDAPVIADLGTGSGAIALALKHARPQAQVHGSDVSPAALAVAQGNGQRLSLNVTWHLGDWWQALPATPAPFLDAVVANPPYVAPGDPHLAALGHEPRHALVPHDDDGKGLADIRRIVSGAQGRLRTGGWLLLEHGFDQADSVQRCLRAAGFEAVASRIDLAGHARATGGRLSAAPG